MTDIDEELRELFLRRAEGVPPHGEVPRSLVSRARRRIALNAAAVGLAVVVLAAGAFVGVRALGGPHVPQPAGKTTPSPTQPSHSPSPSQPSPSATTILACTSAQLRAVASLGGAAGSRVGDIAVTNFSGQTCTLEGTPTITLLDQSGTPITSGITVTPSQAAWVVNRSPQPAGWPVVTLRAGDSASVRIGWRNWCPGGTAPGWRLGIPGGGTVDVSGFGAVGPPPCNGPGSPSTIEEGPFEPRTGP